MIPSNSGSERKLTAEEAMLLDYLAVGQCCGCSMPAIHVYFGEGVDVEAKAKALYDELGGEQEYLDKFTVTDVVEKYGRP